ncbi:MAG: oligosaccharide flippase family protein [Candidatus Thorarchaeota archaeon]
MYAREDQNFFQNIYTLFSGNLVSTLISTIGTILIINLVTTDEYALINISYIFPTILILVSELGLNYACTYYIARFKRENNPQAIRDVVKINLSIKLILGIVFTILVITFSNFISEIIFNVDDSRLAILISISSIGIIGIILFDAINSIFIGYEYMKLFRITSILRKLIDTTLALLLVILGFRLIGPVLGFVLGPLVISIINLIILKKKISINSDEKKSINWNYLSKMMKYGYPLSLVSLIMGIQTQIYSYIFIYFGFIDVVSFFYASTVSSKLVIILTQSISFTLFPTFSKYDWRSLEDREKIEKYFRFSIKLSNFLVLPIVIFLIIFSEDFFPLIYGFNYLSAAPYISLYFFNYLFVSFGSISIPALFLGQKKTKYVLYIELIKLAGGIIFSIILLNFLNSIGIMIGIFIGSILGTIIGNIFIIFKLDKRLFDYFKMNLVSFFMNIILGSLIFLIKMIFVNIKSIYFNLLIDLVLILIYLIILSLVSFYFNIINEKELEAINNHFAFIPVINKIINFISKIQKKMLSLRK